MMCRQVLPDAADGIEQIYIVKTEPGLEDDGRFASMVPETVDHIKTEPELGDEDGNENSDDCPADKAEFEMAEAIIKEEPRVDSGSESEEFDTQLKIKSEPSSIDHAIVKEERKEKSKPKAGKKEAKKTTSKPKQEKKQKSSSKKKQKSSSTEEGLVKGKVYSCPICNKTANNEYNLSKHIKAHEKDKKVLKEEELTCQICNKITSTKWHLEKHLLGHEKKAQKRDHQAKTKLVKLHRFVCRYCPSTFTKGFNLRRHEDLHNIPPEQQIPKRKEFYCYICDKDWGSKQGIQEHLYSHADRLPYTCTECDKPFSITSVRVLNEHLEMHQDTTNGSIKCAWCPLRFHSLKVCKLHEKTHVNESGTAGGSTLEALEHTAKILSKKKNVKVIVVDGALRYACDLCDKSYSLLDTLKDHNNTHTESDRPKKMHVCNICNEVFAFSGGLYTHKKVHLDVLPYKCENCDKAFKTVPQLINHRRVHTGERPFVCRCGQAFAKRYTMMSHKKICLKPELLQTCSCRLCENEPFSSYADLIRHVTQEHTEPIPRTKCQFCPALSQNALLLVRHEHRHQMPDVIQCDQCNRIFKNKELLEEHKVTHVNPEQSLICDICGKIFKGLRRLRYHKQNHTRRKPSKALRYNCEFCSKKFRWLGNFRTHQKLHYNNKSRYFIGSLVEETPPEPDMGDNEEGNEVEMNLGMLVKTEMD